MFTKMIKFVKTSINRRLWVFGTFTIDFIANFSSFGYNAIFVGTTQKFLILMLKIWRWLSFGKTYLTTIIVPSYYLEEVHKDGDQNDQ